MDSTDDELSPDEYCSDLDDAEQTDAETVDAEQTDAEPVGGASVRANVPRYGSAQLTAASAAALQAESSARETARQKCTHIDQIIIPPSQHVTSDVLSQYETCKIVAARASQLSQSSICFVDISDLTDPITMAKRELAEGKCPLLLSRLGPVIRDGDHYTQTVEHWDVNTMIKDINLLRD